MIRKLQLLLLVVILVVAAFSTGWNFLFFTLYAGLLVGGGSYILTRLGLADLRPLLQDAEMEAPLRRRRHRTVPFLAVAGDQRRHDVLRPQLLKRHARRRDQHQLAVARADIA